MSDHLSKDKEAVLWFMEMSKTLPLCTSVSLDGIKMAHSCRAMARRARVCLVGVPRFETLGFAGARCLAQAARIGCASGP